MEQGRPHRGAHSSTAGDVAVSENEEISLFSGEWRFLSNFYVKPFFFEGELWTTAEHAYQASKTESKAERAIIRGDASPSAAKRVGQSVTLRKNWSDELAQEYMFRILMQKFSDDELAAKLVATRGRTLIEGNTWHDNRWGVCTCGKCSGGQNWLGGLLMRIRDEYLVPKMSIDERWPLHAKLKALDPGRPDNQVVGDFIEWLSENDFVIAKQMEGSMSVVLTGTDSEGNEERLVESIDHAYFPVNRSITTWIAEFFEIDEQGLSKEKDEMLRRIREELNG